MHNNNTGQNTGVFATQLPWSQVANDLDSDLAQEMMAILKHEVSSALILMDCQGVLALLSCGEPTSGLLRSTPRCPLFRKVSARGSVAFDTVDIWLWDVLCSARAALGH